MFQSELSTPEESGQRPVTSQPPSTLRPRPPANASEVAISTSGETSHSSSCVSGGKNPSIQ
jgi:hypothetical protein